MGFEHQPRVFLLLDDNPELDVLRDILRSPLDLAHRLVCMLFREDFQSLREDLDVVKGFAAGVSRALTLRDYPLADYYTAMFAFHQWFHSSYRARQGKVLEELLKKALPRCTSFRTVGGKEVLKSFGLSLTSDVDVVGYAESQQRLLLVQLRSRDDTGGTTAKGSLVDALKEILRQRALSLPETLYLIGVWDQRETQQQAATIGKIRSSLQDVPGLEYNFDQLASEIGDGAPVSPSIRLQMAYGFQKIAEAIEHWDPLRTSDASRTLSQTVQVLENWDDLWVAYAVASLEMELYFTRLGGISNARLLRHKCAELGVSLSAYDSYSHLQNLIDETVYRLAAIWKEDTLPFKTPADQILYLRDLLFLLAIYETHCPEIENGGVVEVSERTALAYPRLQQLSLFPENVTAVSDTQETPRLVSFRALAPEITDTTYLTHGLFYYPAKFIPQVPRFCLREYTARGDWVIDPFAGSATVGLEAVLMGRNALLLDLNPLLNHIVPLKILFRHEDVDHAVLSHRLDEMRRSADAPPGEAAEFYPALSNISYWYDPAVLHRLSRYWGWLKSHRDEVYGPIIEAALLKASKHFSYAEHRTPKLFKSKAKRAEMEELLQKDWRTLLDNLIYETAFDVLARAKRLAGYLRFESGEVIYRGGVDSSNPASFQDIPPYRFTAVITSPPYLQAQEYIRTFKLDLSWLGYSEDEIRRLSRLEIPYRRAEAVVSTPTLDRIRSLLRRDDLRTLLDAYFYYTLQGLENAARLLVPGGVLCVFVGNPNVDEFQVETWRIVSEYFGERGFEFVQVYEDRIKSRQLFKGRKNKNPEGIQSEFLLVLRKQ